MKKESVLRSFALAKAQKPAYGEIYPLLEGLFLIQTETTKTLQLTPLELSPQEVQTRWEGGFPLLRRWEFPLDIKAARNILVRLNDIVPSDNRQLTTACHALSRALADHPDRERDFWQCFLQHELEPWEEWVDMKEVEIASLLFLARSCLRPSIEWTATDLLTRFPLPQNWLKGYCAVCGSSPALLFLHGEGERRAYCSWCGTQWGLHRLQCPNCDNRHHESLGYLQVEAEPQYRIQYCRICRTYFKLIDTREMIDFPYLPLEELTTLHLDLLAQRAGWTQPLSPSPTVYGP